MIRWCQSTENLFLYSLHYIRSSLTRQLRRAHFLRQQKMLLRKQYGKNGQRGPQLLLALWSTEMRETEIVLANQKIVLLLKRGGEYWQRAFPRIPSLSFEVQLCAALQNREASGLFKHFRTNTVVNIKIKTFLNEVPEIHHSPLQFHDKTSSNILSFQIFSIFHCWHVALGGRLYKGTQQTVRGNLENWWGLLSFGYMIWNNP